MGNPKLRARRGKVIGFALEVMSFVARRLPLGAVRAIGSFLGGLAWLVLPHHRRDALGNIAIAFPEWPARKQRQTVRQMFHHLGQSMLEWLWLPNLNKENLERLTEIHDAQYIDEALASGKGSLIFTGHVGNWEWLAATVCLLGHPLTVLQRERDEPDLNRFIGKLRAHFGMRSTGRKSETSALEMFRSLRHGGLLAFLIDQNIRTESVKVPFFGKPALTPIGPARLAVRAGAPVMICFAERRNGKQIVHFQKPFTSSDPVEITAKLTAAIEAQIRRAPEQWVWVHNRWRERPDWDRSEQLTGVTAAARSSR